MTKFPTVIYIIFSLRAFLELHKVVTCRLIQRNKYYACIFNHGRLLVVARFVSSFNLKFEPISLNQMRAKSRCWLFEKNIITMPRRLQNMLWLKCALKNDTICVTILLLGELSTALRYSLTRPVQLEISNFCCVI